jgi:heme A synthase
MLAPLVVGTHLLIAMSFLAVLVLLTARAYWATDPDLTLPAPPAGLDGVAYAALALAFLQIALGGYTSAFGAGLACPDFPLCRGALVPQADSLVVLHYVHRLVALTLAVAVAGVASLARRSRDRVVRVAAALAVFVVITQVMLGALNVWTRLAMPVRIAHLGGAAALLSVLIVITVRTHLARGAAEVVAASDTNGAAPRHPRRLVTARATKACIMPCSTAATAMVVAAAPWGATPTRWFWGGRAAGAANAINAYWDRDIDASPYRTRGLIRRRVSGGRWRSAACCYRGRAGAGTGRQLRCAAGVRQHRVLARSYTMWRKRSSAQNIVSAVR